MSFTTFHQYDSRWGKKNYNKTSNMATAGCAPASCATLISGIHPRITPIDTMKYMQSHGYAIPGNGTAWAGIPACLKWGGFEKVAEVSTMKALWDILPDKKYKGVILFKAGRRGGVTWTTAGHFVPFTAYKKKNGKHYLWMRDPGPRNKEGWYCYEDHMKGLCVKVWVGRLPEAKKETTSGTVHELTPKRQKLVDMAKKTAWPYGTPRSKYKYPSGKRRKAYREALNKAYPNRSGWRRQTRMGASCDVYVGTVVRASGVDKKFPRGCDDILKYMRTKHAKSIWRSVKIYDRGKIPPGAVVFQIKKTGAKHITIKTGTNRLANAHYVSKTYPIIQKAYGKGGKIWAKSKCKKFKVYLPKE